MKLSRIALATASCLAGAACTTLPSPKHGRYRFPKEAHVGDVKRPYTVLGQVRAKIDFPTLDPESDERTLCRNYYNRAVQDLVRRARDQGADAVIDVKSVVFLEDGRREEYATPECSDDGGEGQILAQGVAVKWKKEAPPTVIVAPKPRTSPSPAPSPEPGNPFVPAPAPEPVPMSSPGGS
jgi:hypothetical protein